MLKEAPMAKKPKQGRIGLSISEVFANQIIDEILKENPDFINRTGVIKYACRKYYDELKKIKKD